MLFLPEEILQAIGNLLLGDPASSIIYGRLRLCSRFLSRIFTPFFFHRVSIRYIDFSCLEAPPEAVLRSNLKFIRYLELVWADDMLASDAITWTLNRYLRLMPSIQHLRIDWFDEPLTLEHLKLLPKLKYLSFPRSSYARTDSKTRSSSDELLHYPANLQGLDLHLKNYHQDYQPLVDVLMESPRLEKLALICNFNVPMIPTGLLRLSEACRVARGKGGVCSLKIKHLQLGFAFLPIVDDTETCATDYLQHLTDLKCLETLKIYNGCRIKRHRIGSEITQILAEATNIKHLEIEHLTSGIVQLITNIRAANPNTLNSLALPCFEITSGLNQSLSPPRGLQSHTEHTRWQNDNYSHEKYPKCLESIGFHWKKIESTAEQPSTSSEGFLLDFVLHCKGLEEFKFGVATKRHMKILKDRVLQKLTQLKFLELKYVTLGNGRRYHIAAFDDSPPTASDPTEAELDKVLLDSFWVEQDLQKKGKEELHRRLLAKDLFEISRDAWLARDGKGDKLRVVKLGRRSYGTFLEANGAWSVRLV